ILQVRVEAGQNVVKRRAGRRELRREKDACAEGQGLALFQAEMSGVLKQQRQTWVHLAQFTVQKSQERLPGRIFLPLRMSTRDLTALHLPDDIEQALAKHTGAFEFAVREQRQVERGKIGAGVESVFIVQILDAAAVDDSAARVEGEREIDEFALAHRVAVRN